MAQLPTFNARRGIASSQPQFVGADAFGLGDFASTVESAAAVSKLLSAADQAEATRSIAEGTAELKGIISDHKDRISDPREFAQSVQVSISEAYKARLKAATSANARRLIEAGLSDNLIGARTLARHEARVKIVDKTKGDYVTAENQLFKSALAADSEENSRGVAMIFADLTAKMIADGNMGFEEGSKKIVDFGNRLESERMNLAASQQPEKFIEDQRQGVYTGRDSTAVERAVKIATSLIEARTRHDEKEAAAISKTALRVLEFQASQQPPRMNLEDAEEAARFYGWTDDTLKGLIRMQIGLRAANPYQEALIEDATRGTYLSIQPTMRDIHEAMDKLSDLAKAGKIDVRQPEYREEMNRLQRLAGILTTTQNIQLRQGMFDARAAIDRLFREFEPRRYSTPRVAADRARHQRIVTDMTDPGDQRRYVEKLRQEMEAQHRTPDQKRLDDARRRQLESKGVAQ